MAAQKLTTAELLGAFKGAVEPNTSSMGYRIGLVLVTGIMILLPLVYVGLIGAVGYQVYHHAALYSENAFHIIPMVIALVLVLFMLKPFFSPRVQTQRQRQLTRREAPMLFALVGQICETIGAPQPITVHIDCDVNASAGFRTGLRSFWSNDLALTIGLPLVAGLNIRQLSGVIAHEFGHFSQGAAMRLTYVVRHINAWFVRAVFERDAWDEGLVRACEDEELWFMSFLAWPIRICVWVTRKILHLLMLLGQAVSCFMSREMEYDADRYQARLIGSHACENTLRDIITLSVAQRGAFSDLRELGMHGVLADDLPRLIVHNVGQIPDEVHMHIRSMIRDDVTKLLSTHPSDRDRIDRIRAYRFPGVFALERPATELFANFADLSRQLTLEMYREIFGLAVHPNDLINIEKIVGPSNPAALIERVWLSPFSMLCSYMLPPKLPEATAIDPHKALERVRASIQNLNQSRGAYDAAFNDIDRVDDIVTELYKANALAEASIDIVPEAFDWPLATSQHRATTRKSVGRRRDALQEVLLPIEKQRAQRVVMSLWLLSHTQRRVANADKVKQEVESLLATSHALTRMWPQVNRARRQLTVLGTLLGYTQEYGEPKPLKHVIANHVDAQRQRIKALKMALDAVDYPFKNSHDASAIGELLFPKSIPQDPAELAEVSSAALNALCRVQIRCLSRLSEVVESVEEALDIQSPTDKA